MGPVSNVAASFPRPPFGSWLTHLLKNKADTEMMRRTQPHTGLGEEHSRWREQQVQRPKCEQA